MRTFHTMDGYLFYLINQSMHCRLFDRFFPIFTYIAGITFTIVYILLSFALDPAFGRTMLFAVLLLPVLVQLGKKLIRRERPFDAKDMARVWEKFMPGFFFPSGTPLRPLRWPPSPRTFGDWLYFLSDRIFGGAFPYLFGRSLSFRCFYRRFDGDVFCNGILTLM